MKKYIREIIFVVSITAGISEFKAQAQTVQQLKPAANPSYMLLGIAPSNIERPSTPKEFAASIQNAVVNGKVAPNFALEVNPYELFSKNRGLSYNDKLIKYTLQEATLKDNLLNNLSLSLATSETDTVALGRLKKGSSAAIGIKTILINGRPKPKTYMALLGLTNGFKEENIYNYLNNLIDNMNAGDVFDEQKLNTFMSNALISKSVSKLANPALTDEQILVINQRVETVLNDIKDQLKGKIDWQNDPETTRKSTTKAYLLEKAAKIHMSEVELLKVVNHKAAFAREGFIMDLSGAYMGHFENSDWEALHSAKWSAWTTLSYRLNADKSLENVSIVDIIGLIRYTGNDIKVDSSSYFDGGLKIQYTYNKISFSGEYVRRLLSQKPASIKTDYTYRATFNIDYVLNDFITLKASLGRTFDGNSTVYDSPAGKIFAVGGLTFSFLNGQ